MLTLGSLFDGAGTFPFAAQQCGVKAVWASEIESFPVEVTKKRFPEMKHLGDITKVDGAEIEPRIAQSTKCGGNGMALPCVLYVMENVVSVLSLRLLDSLLEVSE